MAGVMLYDYQLDAVKRMKIGCILCGGVGSGKSRTSLAFYYKLYDGEVNTENYVRMIEPPGSLHHHNCPETGYRRVGRRAGSFLYGDGPGA